MGVKGLESFVEQNCPRACQRVRIAELANAHSRRLQGSGEPVIAVDAMGLLHFIYDDLDGMLGGQWREFEENVEHFLSSFRRLGIHLVFFFDGTTVSSKRQQWVQRRLEEVKDVKQIMAYVRQFGREPDRSLLRKASLPPGTGIIMRMVLKHWFKCDVRTTVRECDEELAEFTLVTPECFALLGQDSDYIIYQRKVAYLSIKHLDMRQMETVSYDQRQVADYLNLRPTQLPLLACLKGNDIIDRSLLQPFHGRLAGGRRSGNDHAVLRSVADFLQTLPPEVDSYGRNIHYHLEEISKIVFGSPNQAPLLAKALTTYGIAIPEQRTGKSYGNDANSNVTLPPGQDFVVAQAGLQKHVHTENIPYVYSIMCGSVYESSTTLEDSTYTDLPPSALLYRPVRQRTYGLLIASLGRTFVEEWCVYGENPLIRPDRVEPLPLLLPSGGRIISLQELWLSQSVTLRWEVYCACIGTTFSAEEARNIPLGFIAPCSIINYLIQNTTIAVWEVAALLAQTVHPLANNAQQLRALQVDDVTVRLLNLCTVFMRGVTMVLHVIGVCGNPFGPAVALPSSYFNGKLFQRCYTMASHGACTFDLCGRSAKASEEFMQLFTIVTAKTRLSGSSPSKMLANYEAHPQEFSSRSSSSSSYFHRQSRF